MPKIIENVREQLLCEAKRQIEQNGYAKTTIRSVALACGIGVGTVYNYFKSKDVLIASFMVEEWQTCLLEMKNHKGEDTKTALKGIYEALCAFTEKHKALFRDKSAARSFMSAFETRHKQLRGQISEVILPLCQNSKVENCQFLSEFIAESFLSFSAASKDFEEIYSVVALLL